MASSLSKNLKLHVKKNMLIWDLHGNLGPAGLLQACVPSIDYGRIAPSHIREGNATITDSIYGFLSGFVMSIQVGEGRGNYRDSDAGGRGGA